MGELHPQMKAILDKIAETDLPPLQTLSPAAARAQGDASFVPFWNANPPAVRSVTNVTFPGPAGPVAVRLYDPGVTRPAPCLVYLHGGGWVIGSLDAVDDPCRRIALAGRVLVASIDYRLAPEHKFPAGLEDCIAAVRWAAGAGEAHGIDGRRLAVGGDSAGANLSLATLVALRDAGGPRLRGGLLIYGAYSMSTDSPSHRAFGDGRYILSLAEMDWFTSHYFASPCRSLRSARRAAARRPRAPAAALSHRRRVRSAARRHHRPDRAAEAGRRQLRVPVLARPGPRRPAHGALARPDEGLHRRDRRLAAPHALNRASVPR
jgi:acetyl esterase